MHDMVSDFFESYVYHYVNDPKKVASLSAPSSFFFCYMSLDIHGALDGSYLINETVAPMIRMGIP